MANYIGGPSSVRFVENETMRIIWDTGLSANQSVFISMGQLG